MAELLSDQLHAHRVLTNAGIPEVDDHGVRLSLALRIRLLVDERDELHFDARVALPEAQERFQRAENELVQLQRWEAAHDPTP